MTIIEKIRQDHLDSRKAKDKALTAILTTLMGEVQMIGKNDGNRETTDEEATKMIVKFRKGVEDTVKIVEKSSDATEAYYYEISIYDKYLPKQMTSEELQEAVSKIVDLESRGNPDLSKKDMGKIMGILKSKYGSTYDGKEASKLVSAKL